jgi:hypothetical protein
VPQPIQHYYHVCCAVVLSFKPVIAPFKAVVLPLDSRLPRAAVQKIASNLTAVGLSSIVDDSGASIGKRYSRVDEIGVPFCITFDHESLVDNAVTIRERDTCAQIRVPIDDVVAVVRSLVEEAATWASYMSKYPVVTTGEDKAASAGASTDASALKGAAPAAAKDATVASTASVGTVGIVVEGKDRLYGRFSRPVTI